MRPILIGILSAFFFAFTFVLNHAMELSGGSWIWSASLRYFFMVPLLFIIVLFRKNLIPLLKIMKQHPIQWLVWSTVGFGLFYAPICIASAYSPGWLVAGTWQLTIISGSLLAPFFYITIQTEKGERKVRGKIPFRGLMFSLLIVAGVLLMQMEQMKILSTNDVLWGILPVIIATFAYPLGNRKMMDVCQGKLDPYQRVLGMTLASLPFWIILSVYGILTVGAPSVSQTVQSSLVALFSGVVATVLFFSATDMVRGNMQKLGAVEATQSFEVLFALIGEIIFLSVSIPQTSSWIGIFLLIVGMILHSYLSHSGQQQKQSLSA